MNFYTRQHEFHCGIDLHARRMYKCVARQDGEMALHQNLKTKPQDVLDALKPFRDRDIVVGLESTFHWYWLDDRANNQVRRSSTDRR